MQVVYNLFNPTEGRRQPVGFQGPDFGQTIEAATEKGMGVVAIKVLAGGPLGGSTDPHPLNQGSRTEGESRLGRVERGRLSSWKRRARIRWPRQPLSTC